MTNNQFRLILLLLGALLFLPFLGNAPLFDWDEINFAESAREMIVTGNYSRVQINFQPFWEKPPLFLWLQVLSMKAFGINEYAARFPNAIFGIITLLTLFEIGKELRSARFGFLCAICMCGSFLPLIYFKSGIIDPVFNYFIFTSIWFLSRSIKNYGNKSASRHSLYAGLLIGLAILTKGPVGLLLMLLTVLIYWIFIRFRAIASLRSILIFAFTTISVSAFWFLPETIMHGPWFLEEFIEYQIRLFTTPDAGHEQPFYYHLLIVLIGCFPMSVVGLRTLFRRSSLRLNDPDFIRWMKVLFWVVLILFSIVTTKIIHYSSMTYLPLSMIAALSLEEWLEGKQSWNVFQLAGAFIIGIIPALVVLGVPLAGMNIAALKPFIKDASAIENLKAVVTWNSIDLVPGMILLTGLCAGIFWLSRGIRRHVPLAFFGSVILATSVFIATFPTRIAGYTQQAAVDFYVSLQGKDVYVETLGFKSFAQYFYSRKQGFSKMEILNSKDDEGNYNIDVLRNWYLTGETDKPVYFVVKSNKIDAFNFPDLQRLSEKNGFVFLLRPAARSKN